MKQIHIIFFMLLAVQSLNVRAQNADKDSIEVTEMDYQIPIQFLVDTVADENGKYLCITLPKVLKIPPPAFADERSRENYYKLVKHIKKVLPYAVSAKQLILETYQLLQCMDEKERKKHIKILEKELRSKYLPIFKKLSTSEGVLLTKLIDRECGMSGYEIAKTFLGSFDAGKYQLLGKMFGQDLKRRYDPKGADRITERLVKLVESGQI